MPTLCLGEALVDLICERWVAGLHETDAFVPHAGGAVANVAVWAARQGAHVELAGGAGDDAWGRWLREALVRAGVGVDAFVLRPGAATPVAFVTVAPGGEPAYALYGGGLEDALAAAASPLERALERCDALFLSSNTLVGERARAVTLGARERVLARGRPIVVDANLRLQRWPAAAAAADAVRECLPGAFLFKANAQEAALLTGEEDPERAAAALVAAGARLALVTLGARGAILRGAERADAPGVPATVRSTVGAGDAVAGVVLARLALAGFYPPAAAAALPAAVAAGARATETWGALP